MKLNICAVTSALVLGLGAMAAHADTTFTFTLQRGTYPSITATTPDSYVYDMANNYYETTNIVDQQIGYSTEKGLILFGYTGVDFASKDADVATTQNIFDGTSFLDGTCAALLYNDYPQQLSGIPEGSGLAGTLVISSTAPEPSSLLLLGTGALGGLATMRRRWFVRA